MSTLDLFQTEIAAALDPYCQGEARPGGTPIQKGPGWSSHLIGFKKEFFAWGLPLSFVSSVQTQVCDKYYYDIKVKAS